MTLVWNELLHVSLEDAQVGAAWDRPPPYLRIGGKSSYTLRARRDRLLRVPATSPRKPAEALEQEVGRWRQEALAERSSRRKEARQRRRLARKCQPTADELSGCVPEAVPE